MSFQSFQVPRELELEMDRLIGQYPQKRSASLMLLHAIQDHFGHISNEAAEWTADKLGLSPINIYELLTFYPMFRQEAAGRHCIKICRTLSCALGGAKSLHKHLCQKLQIDAEAKGRQCSPDGRFSVEWVECLASCGTPPVMMCDDAFFENVSTKKAETILREYQNQKSKS